jgi:hypothetical protein
MLVTNIITEDTANYKKISMFIGTPYCSGKCWRELGLDCSICQNDRLRDGNKLCISINDLIELYDNHPLCEAVVFGGMEPLDSVEDLNAFVMNFRYRHPDPIVIYTGYTEKEAKEKLQYILLHENIIVKYGRYIPDQPRRYDDILGVKLASPNQYAKKYNVIEGYC